MMKLIFWPNGPITVQVVAWQSGAQARNAISSSNIPRQDAQAKLRSNRWDDLTDRGTAVSPRCKPRAPESVGTDEATPPCQVQHTLWTTEAKTSRHTVARRQGRTADFSVKVAVDQKVPEAFPRQRERPLLVHEAWDSEQPSNSQLVW